MQEDSPCGGNLVEFLCSGNSLLVVELLNTLNTLLNNIRINRLLNYPVSTATEAHPRTHFIFYFAQEY